MGSDALHSCGGLRGNSGLQELQGRVSGEVFLRVDKLYMYEDERVWLAAPPTSMHRMPLAACRPCPTSSLFVLSQRHLMQAGQSYPIT